MADRFSFSCHQSFSSRDFRIQRIFFRGEILPPNYITARLVYLEYFFLLSALIFLAQGVRTMKNKRRDFPGCPRRYMKLGNVTDIIDLYACTKRIIKILDKMNVIFTQIAISMFYSIYFKSIKYNSGFLLVNIIVF